MGLFSRHLSGSQKEQALAMVRHLQTMLAYQHLATETYNDATVIVAGKLPHGAEVAQRAYVEFSDPGLVAQYLIPAVTTKIEILELIETKHREASVLATGSLQRPYEEMTAAINVMLDRARYQKHGFEEWVNDPQVEIDALRTVRFDVDERAAMDRAVEALNELIVKKVGLTADE